MCVREFRWQSIVVGLEDHRPGLGQPSLGYARAGLRRASCSARALSTSKVSVPATAMADKLITSWITEPIASLGTQ